MSNLSVVISNQEFISAYDKLGIASVNYAQRKRNPLWDQYVAVFQEIQVNLHPKPTDKVVHTYLFNHINSSILISEVIWFSGRVSHGK